MGSVAGIAQAYSGYVPSVAIPPCRPERLNAFSSFTAACRSGALMSCGIRNAVCHCRSSEIECRCLSLERLIQANRAAGREVRQKTRRLRDIPLPPPPAMPRTHLAGREGAWPALERCVRSSDPKSLIP